MKYAPVLLVLNLCLLITGVVRAQSGSMAATDDSFEDRVELSWTMSIPSGQFFRVERDAVVLAIRSRTETSYADRSGDPGATYLYCVIPSDAQGNDGTPVCDAGRRSILPAGAVAASDRTLEDRVSVTWSDRSEIEAGYRVYRTTVSATDSTLLATLAANRVVYNDPTAVVGTTYRYCIVAFDGNGFSSVAACDEGTRGAVMPPAAVVATDGQFNDRVRVTWVDQTSEETGYTIYRDGAEVGAVAIDETLFDDLTATPEVDYDYCVTATIGGIESTQVCDSGRRGGLTPPQSVVATDNTFDDRVDLAWQDVADTEDGFLVSRYLGGVLDSVFAALGHNAKTFSDASAEQAVTYSYCVQSFSDVAAPDRSLSVKVCDDGTRSAVLAPTDVSATDRTYEDKSEITWSSASTTAMLFNIYRDDVLVDNVPGNETLFGDMQIASGTEYDYCVSAMTVTGANPSLQAEVAELVRAMRPAQRVDADGEAHVTRNPEAVLLAVEQLARPSLSVGVTASQLAVGDIVESAQVCDTGSRLLEPPTDVAATFEDFEDRVEISWTDNSSVERGHRIYRQGPADPQAVLVGEANTGRVTFGDYRGTPGVTYTYSVRTFDLRGPGGESSADSDTGARKLEAPTGLRAADDNSETEVSLSWKDNSRAESGYEIKRDGSVIATTAANAISYRDTTPVPGVLHRYELTAVDSLGRSEAAVLDAGSFVRPAGSFNASDTYTNRVVLAWDDRSTVETNYQVTRNGDLLAVLEPGSTGYEDFGAVPGTIYTYCVTTGVDLGFVVTNSVPACDTGIRAVEVFGDLLQRVTPVDSTLFSRVPGITSTFTLSGQTSVAISGTAAVFGVPYGGPLTTVLGTCDGCGYEAPQGAVYIFEQNPASRQWVEAAQFLSENYTETYIDRFGGSVAISNNTIVVAATGLRPPSTATNGLAVVIVRDEITGQWVRSQVLRPSLPSSLGNVAIDGNTILFTGSGQNQFGFPENRYVVFERPSEGAPFVELRASSFANANVSSVSISGDYFIVGGIGDGPSSAGGSARPGQAILYRRDPAAGTWEYDDRLGVACSTNDLCENPQSFGQSVSISGSFAFVSDGGGTVYVYRRDPATGRWGEPRSLGLPTATELQRLVAPVNDDDDEGDEFGASVSVSGGLAAISASRFGECPAPSNVGTYCGTVFLYRLLAGGEWEYFRRFDPQGDERMAPPSGAFDLSADGFIFGVEEYLPSTATKQDPVIPRFYATTRPIDDVLVPPLGVAATDGTFDARIQVAWNDQSENEDGYRVYRDDELIAELAPNTVSFSDFDIFPGQLAEYCVETFRLGVGDAPRACDFGWRPVDGAISGSVRAASTSNSASLRVTQNAEAVVGSMQGGATSSASTGLQTSADPQDSVLVCLSPDPDRSLLFDGSGGSVEIPDFVTLPGSFTIEFWARRTEIDDGEHVLISIGDAESMRHVSARFLPDGTFRFSLGGVEGVLDMDVVQDEDVDWHHWALTQASGGPRQVLRDGQVVLTDATPISLQIKGPLVLGSFFGASGFFAGVMDEMRVWQNVQTPNQIAALKDQRLAGDEEGLIGYWPMNQGRGRAMGDETRFGRHGRFQDGVYWSTAGALPTCTLADTQGKFTLGSIRYNESTTFVVTPIQAQRTFAPPASEITLSTQNPVENQVDFVDVTQLGVTGRVLFAGTECPVPDVEILANDVVRGTTVSDGTFRASLSPRAEEAYRFVPRRVNPEDPADTHDFVPSSRDLIVDRALFGVDFADTKTRPLHAFFGGSCELVADLGSVTIEVTTENGCFSQEYQVSGGVDIDLPPQKYLVQVKDVQTADDNLRADMIQYFDDLGVQEIDLTNARDTLDLTYHAPIGMTISGFPAPPTQCTTYTNTEGGTLPLVPVLQQGRSYDLTLNVREDYGLGRVCPVSNGTVSVFDAIADSANTKRVYDIEDGKVVHETIAASPNIFKGASVDGTDRSFQKSFTASAQVPGRDPFALTEWVIIEGVRARTSEFVSATTEPFPLLIVHDPPGSNSSAFVEEGTMACATMSNMQLLGGGAGAQIDVVLGFKASVGFGFVVENGAGLALRTKTIVGGDQGSGSALEICATTSERFGTSADIGWSGEDLFMGVALNLVFARADELGVNQCSVQLTERLAADLDTDNAFETTFVYGATHIRDSLIPDLTELIELSGGDPSLSGDPNGDGEPETVRLTQALDNWKSQLANNEKLKTEALEGTVENRSFSAGADYEYSESNTSVRSSTQTTRFYVNSESGIGAVFTAGYDQTILLALETRFEKVTENGSSEGSSKTVGYTLSDGDTGDFFSVDVGTDPRYGTPVFGTVSGRSSNPWEANTQRRDWPLLSASPPVQYNVPPDEAARFTLNLTNASESDEPREYVLTTVRPSNPGGASFSIGGTAAGGTYLIEAGETQEVTVAVSRGPSRYSYEDLELIAYPQKEFEIWQADTRQQFVMSDTARFSVYFEAPCSDIAILRPKDLWSVNKASIDDSLEVILRDFDLSGSDIFDVNRIGFQYRRGGSPDWFPGRSILVDRVGPVEADSLDAVARSWIARWQPQKDGAYDLRAFTECSNGESVYSESVAGVVDTKAPKILGAPAPADEVLTFGGSIAATFDEPVACSSIVTSGENTNTTLTYLDGPLAGTALSGFEAVCDGKTVVLDPPVEFDWTPAEGRLVQTALAGVTDIYENPVAEPIRWQFTVRRSAFAWDPANLNAEIPRGTSMKVEARLINGRAQPADYGVPETLLLLPENGSTAIPLAVSNTEGTVVAQGEQKVSFTVPDSLLPGRYTSTLQATRYENDAAKEQTPLYFTADVVCRAPEWEINPFAFEQSMTMTARLTVDGSTSTDTTDVVVAMVEGEVRGVSRVAEPSAGVFLVQMLIYGNRQGDLVKFQVWDSDRCMLHRETSKAFLFRSGQILGTFGAPVDLEAPPQEVPQAVNLAAGWTWFSTNRIATDPSINSVLSGVISAPGDIVKSQTAYAQYDPASGWVGPLTEIENGTGYFAKLQQSNRLLQNGTATDPTSPITLNKGWTWIGYLPTTPLAVNDALASLTPAAGDLIKSQYGFAQFADGIGWVGSLSTLEPGLGYLMYTNEAGTLAYPSAGTSVSTRAGTIADGSNVANDAKSTGKTASVTDRREDSNLKEVKAGLAEDRDTAGRKRELEVREDGRTEWVIAARDFPETMTIVAEVRRKGVLVDDPQVQIGLFAGDELRGLGRISHVDAVNRDIAFIMVYGDETSAEPLEMRLLDPATGQVEIMSQHPTFEANARLGTVEDALVLDTASEELPTEYALDSNYPNPFNPETAIRFALPEASPVQLDVFDVIGRHVAVLMLEEKVTAGWHVVQFDGSDLSSGVYFYRIKAGDFKAVHKMTLLK